MPDGGADSPSLPWRLEPLPASGFRGERRAPPGFGVMVAGGCDLAELADKGTGTAELEALLVEHGVVVIKDQRLTERQEVDVRETQTRLSTAAPPHVVALFRALSLTLGRSHFIVRMCVCLCPTPRAISHSDVLNTKPDLIVTVW